MTAITEKVESPDSFIEQPAKLLRIVAVARAMLKEARDTPCDPAGCERFKEIYERTVQELSDVLSEDLWGELSFLTANFDDLSPSPSELRVAQAELVGWLEGLFNGIAVAAQSQVMAAQEQTQAVAEVSETPMPGLYL